jgi:PHS family inorganic phosphate transporter-like MFS transporter
VSLLGIALTLITLPEMKQRSLEENEEVSESLAATAEKRSVRYS